MTTIPSHRRKPVPSDNERAVHFLDPGFRRDDGREVSPESRRGGFRLNDAAEASAGMMKERLSPEWPQ